MTSSTIFVICETKLAPRDKQDFISNVVNPLVSASSKEEENIYYDFININDYNGFIEAFKSESALEKHFASDLFIRLFPEIKQHIYRLRFVKDLADCVINLPQKEIVHLIVNVKLIPDSKGEVNTSKFLELAEALVKDTRLNDPGCIMYTIGKVISFAGIECHENEYMFIEFWENDQTLEAHTDRVKRQVNELDMISSVQFVLKSYYTPSAK